MQRVLLPHCVCLCARQQLPELAQLFCPTSVSNSCCAGGGYNTYAVLIFRLLCVSEASRAQLCHAAICFYAAAVILWLFLALAVLLGAAVSCRAWADYISFALCC